MQLQTRFMSFVADLGARSLQEGGSGVGYFRLPNLTPVYVLSNRAVIKKFYEGNAYLDNEQKKQIRFGQKKFFTRLAIILGQDNLMSADLGSATHSEVRAAILSRNEMFRPKIADLVLRYFKEYEKSEQGRPLSDVMDALSRQVLIATYFDPLVINQFETLYKPELTKELISFLFSLDPISTNEQQSLVKLREKIFELGCNLIFSTSEIKQQLLEEKSWLNYLLKIRVLGNEALQDELARLDIFVSPKRELSSSQCERLVRYAISNNDRTPLAAAVKDAVNESLFIPLLGFDATATALITSLRIIIQDRRIYTLVMKEIREKLANQEDFVLHSPWDLGKEGALSYMEAVILEALRLSPPAPMIPETINETLSLGIDGKTLVLPKGALVFIPLESLHVHPSYFPDIPLSPRGQEILGKQSMSASDIFPERWLPKHKDEIYNADFFQEGYLNETDSSVNPRQLEKEGGLLTFKTGPRRCPGLRIALAEILALFKMLSVFKFELDNEENLALGFHYATPLQRNGGKGTITITPLEETKQTATVRNSAAQESSFSASGNSPFFKSSPESRRSRLDAICLSSEKTAMTGRI
ncbi:cytochrome P450 [Legionella micdadei]|nr:cytochrome P450 [Legionella micdadei]